MLCPKMADAILIPERPAPAQLLCQLKCEKSETGLSVLPLVRV